RPQSLSAPPLRSLERVWAPGECPLESSLSKAVPGGRREDPLPARSRGGYRPSRGLRRRAPAKFANPAEPDFTEDDAPRPDKTSPSSRRKRKTMRLIKFTIHDDPTPRVGLLQGEHVIPLAQGQRCLTGLLHDDDVTGRVRRQ